MINILERVSVNSPETVTDEVSIRMNLNEKTVPLNQQ